MGAHAGWPAALPSELLIVTLGEIEQTHFLIAGLGVCVTQQSAAGPWSFIAAGSVGYKMLLEDTRLQNIDQEHVVDHIGLVICIVNLSKQIGKIIVVIEFCIITVLSYNQEI